MAEEKEELEKKKKGRKSKKDKNASGDKASENGSQSEEETSAGGKLVMVFVTILIILIWLGIFAVLIKTDVGGFGSTVLSPVLKNVPVINKILPADESDQAGTESSKYKYDSMDQAVARIKELESQLDDALASNKTDQDTIADLQQQIADLEVYKQEQADFEKTKEKFYEEVVFSDNAPDIEEYKAYYESIEPENAEVLYKQVVQQLQTDSQIQDYAATYSAMKPKEAAGIFDTMTDDLNLVAKILQAMDSESRGKILEAMDANIAAKVTQIMEP